MVSLTSWLYRKVATRRVFSDKAGGIHYLGGKHDRAQSYTRHAHQGPNAGLFRHHVTLAFLVVQMILLVAMLQG